MKSNLSSAPLAKKSRNVLGLKRRTPWSTRLSSSVSIPMPRHCAGRNSVSLPLFSRCSHELMYPKTSQAGAPEEEGCQETQTAQVCWQGVPQHSLRSLNIPPQFVVIRLFMRFLSLSYATPVCAFQVMTHVSAHGKKPNFVDVNFTCSHDAKKVSVVTRGRRMMKSRDGHSSTDVLDMTAPCLTFFFEPSWSILERRSTTAKWTLQPGAL